MSLLTTTGLELDTDPPRVVQAFLEGVDLHYGNDEARGMKLYPHHGFSKPTREGVPDAEACYRALQSRPTYSIEPKAGQTFCAYTSEGGVARLEIEHEEYKEVVVRVTAWKPVGETS
ncbi:hypothetical protein Sme01_27400 [Sphaerisporangium melleum]|uniref:Uncharacterized protein n=1 Tax=Sphaerisporangium melleum TaxID=321316 RepID=A0A917QVT7_9ACTN|nr:hypothetical protein GCM10007964_11950 [Sphaerisporangium melleum]GII70264.1 hypothetical protein Sme01_27400 [Sphaerisporangium melleum]